MFSLSMEEVALGEQNLRISWIDRQGLGAPLMGSLKPVAIQFELCQVGAGFSSHGCIAWNAQRCLLQCVLQSLDCALMIPLALAGQSQVVQRLRKFWLQTQVSDVNQVDRLRQSG